MEETQNANRRAASGRRMLAQARALELEAKHPQLSMFDNQPEPTIPMSGGAMNEAGLRRVVGGRRKSKKAMMMGEGELNITHGGGKLEITHSGSDSETEACREGKMLADHLGKLHGSGFLDDFAKGFMSVIRPLASVASFIPGPIGMAGRVVSGLAGGGRSGGAMCGAGQQVGHSGMSGAKQGLPGSGTGGQDVPPGGVAPVAYGSPPQAPASFARNTAGMGRPRAVGMGRAGGAMPMEKAAKRSSQRGQMISKLMKEHGMTLGQASKHLKENGGA